MNNVYEEVANAALTLPPEDRAMLADDLVASLEASQAEMMKLGESKSSGALKRSRKARFN